MAGDNDEREEEDVVVDDGWEREDVYNFGSSTLYIRL